MDRSASDSQNLLDRAAVALSGLCVLHCLALPLVLVAAPVLGQLADTHFHLQMLIAVVPVSALALGLGFRRHRNPLMLVWGSIGMTLLIVGATWAHYRMGLTADRLMTLFGSLILAATHYANSRLAKRHRARAC